MFPGRRWSLGQRPGTGPSAGGATRAARTTSGPLPRVEAGGVGWGLARCGDRCVPAGAARRLASLTPLDAARVLALRSDETAEHESGVVSSWHLLGGRRSPRIAGRTRKYPEVAFGCRKPGRRQGELARRAGPLVLPPSNSLFVRPPLAERPRRRRR